MPHLRALRDRIHGEVCERGYNPRINVVHAVLWQRRARCEHAGDSARRLLAGERSARRGHGRGGREDAACATASCCATAPSTAPTAFPAPKARSSRAVSGWPTTTPSPDESKRPNTCFERLLGLRNHLGLLAEEYDPALKRQLGNFPQAFSHLALIFTARVIDTMRRKGQAPTHEDVTRFTTA